MAYGFNDDRSKVDVYSADEIDDMMQDIDDDVTAETNNRIAGDNALDARIDTILTGYDDDPNKDSELVDIRTGYNGVAYLTAGHAVREQFNILSDDTTDTIAFDGWVGDVNRTTQDGFSRYISKPLYAPAGSIVSNSDSSINWFPLAFNSTKNAFTMYNDETLKNGYDAGSWGNLTEFLVQRNSWFIVYVRDIAGNTFDPDTLIGTFTINRPKQITNTSRLGIVFSPSSSDTHKYLYEKESNSSIYITKPLGFIRGSISNEDFQNNTNFANFVNFDFDQTSPSGIPDCVNMQGNAALVLNMLENTIRIITTYDDTNMYDWWNSACRYDVNDYEVPLLITTQGNIVGGLAAYVYLRDTERYLTNNALDDLTVQTEDAIYELANNLPSYWVDYTENRIFDILNMMTNASINSDTFIFITDVHYSQNTKNSPELIRHIEKKCNIHKCFFGGDILTQHNSVNEAKTLEQMWISDMYDTYLYPTVGNHDYNTNSSSSPYPLNASQVYNTVYKPTENLVDTERKMYYSVDNATQKIRYIVLCTEENQKGNISSEQINWLKSSILELDSDWTVVVFAHRYWMPSLASQYTDADVISGRIESLGATIKAAIDDVYDAANATVAALIVGHVHRDLSTTTNKGYLIISTANDVYTQSAQWDTVLTNRTSGNVSEQLFDVFTIDTYNKTISTVRIGAGNDRTWNY